MSRNTSPLLSLNCLSPGQYQLQGKLSIDSLESLWKQREVLLNQDCQLNLADLTSMDSAGLALLVDLLAQAKTLGKQLRVTELNAQVWRLIEVNQLSSLFISPELHNVSQIQG